MNHDIHPSLALLPAPVALLGVVILLGVVVDDVAS
jgi:hypothetical protein